MRKYKSMKKYKRSSILSILLISCCTLLLGACGSSHQQEQGQKSEVVSNEYGPGSYDSADTAVLVAKDEEAKTITLLNLDLGRTYTLSVAGSASITDKYGEAMSLGQIGVGEIVDVTFLKDKKRLNSMQISPEAWSKEHISRYEIDTIRKEISVGSEVFQMTSNTQFISLDERVELMDLNPVDQITLKGIGTSALAVVVTQGHGYLRLQNDTQFLGGFIEVGDSIIHLITEDMLLTVPEGSYQVVISHKLGGGKKNITIQRNKEVALDIGDLQIEAPKTGIVVFSMTPQTATLYVDGQKVDTSSPVSLTYGIHQIIARADGYKSLTSYIKVASASGGIDVTLDSEVETETDKTEGYKVYIDAPEEAEVFLDGNYVGIVPTSFKKEAGSHSITLRRSGYETRSYTIQVDSDAKDVNYSFAELSPEETASPTASPTLTPAPSPTPTADPEAEASPGPSASPEAEASPSPSASPEAEASPSPSASPEAEASPSPSASPEAEASPNPTVSPEGETSSGLVAGSVEESSRSSIAQMKYRLFEYFSLGSRVGTLTSKLQKSV